MDSSVKVDSRDFASAEKMDCRADFQSARNDRKNNADSKKVDSRLNAPFLSSRAVCQHGVAIHKGAQADSKKNAQNANPLESLFEHNAPISSLRDTALAVAWRSTSNNAQKPQKMDCRADFQSARNDRKNNAYTSTSTARNDGDISPATQYDNKKVDSRLKVQSVKTPAKDSSDFTQSYRFRLWQNRWHTFAKNTRARISLYLFAALCLLALLAPLLANHKPLLIYHNAHFYFPLWQSYPESTFGGDFDTEPDYNDPYMQELLRDSFVLKAPIPYSYDTIVLDLHTPAPTPPSLRHWLGTDDQARDVLARLIYGVRTSIAFGLILSACSVVIGIAIGGLQGYYGGLLDLIGQRGIEVYASIPLLFLLIILSSFITPSFWWILGIVLAFSWISLSAIVRAEFLKVRESLYVKAARALGASDMRIMLMHILPNACVATIAYVPFLMVGSIGTLVTLDFLGFGMPVGSASLGELLEQGKNNLASPHLALSGFSAVALLLSLLCFIGEGVRDALNPSAQPR